ncbi:carbohydrate ABC transporter permease [Amycolatopsis sp. YIM 10]|uniref:carbohydrate ABC transporter permease n=1 Tax=Amycolatopsis sp. YIM 10 TaxID=2653857 RepID=UPI0012902D74|nr:carbohydrate ABC transporter permease [Amycolatopsis sp. YIM 10]QFU89355.1 L-arabinose transport system permease protein AraQ [Amycolatopsis sp. YIM 10]
MRRRDGGRVLSYSSLVLVSLVMLVPLVVIFLGSLKQDAEFRSSGPFTPPENWLNLSNYATALVDGGMVGAFANTVLILVVSVAGTVLIGSMAAYAIDRFRFRFRKAVLSAFLVATLVPSVTTQVATFQVVNRLGLFDTRAAAIALFMGTDIVSIYIFLQFIRSIPRDLDEAAALDGASRLGVYWRIILPLLKPAIATVVIIKGIAIYNEFYIPFLYMPSRDLGVISTSLFRFKGPFSAQWEVISAGVIIVVLPTLVVFLLLQRWIYRGFAAGATK